MTIEEYFGDWMKVIDKLEAMKIMGWLKTVNPNTLCPALPNVFRAFKLCSLSNCKVVMVGMDPYPDKFMGKQELQEFCLVIARMFLRTNYHPPYK